MMFRGLRIQGWHPIVVTMAVTLGLCSLVVFNLLDARRDNWERTSQSTRNLARAVAEEIGRTVESLDLSLQGVVDNSLVPGVMELEPRLRDLALFGRAATARNLGYLMLLDADGRLVATARPGDGGPSSFADRSYFTIHRDDQSPGLQVSSPFRGRFTGQWAIALSRRVAKPDGSFGGVAVGTIRLDTVRDLFAAMDLGAHGSISLFHDDGALVMRVPYRAAFIGSDVGGTEVHRRSKETPGGQFIAISALDGVRRLHTLADVGGGPLHVAVSLSVAEVEAGWWRQAGIVGSSACVLVGILVLAALALRRELRRRQEAEAAARESEANFRLLAENCGDMVSRIGSDGVRRYVSPASFRLLGLPSAELVGRRPQEEIHPNDAAGLAAAAERLQYGEAEEATVAYRTRRADGSWIWVESMIRVVRDPVTGTPDGLVVVSRDVTERKNVEAELARLATIDGLTGVANRRTFDEALQREWRHCARTQLPLSMLLVDVDHFKALNDSQGHQRGDECLRQIGEVLGSTVRRAGDLAARYGGEEFTVLLPETDAVGAAAVAERLRVEIESLALPHPASGVAGGVVTVSVGGATLWPLPGEEAKGPAELLGLADEGLYEAKRTGRNRTVHMKLNYAL